MKTDYFDIVAGALQGDTLAPYLFIIYRDYVLRTSIDLKKENGFKLAKGRSSNEQVLEATPNKKAPVRSLTTHHENYPS